jgi:hypothetical protein
MGVWQLVRTEKKNDIHVTDDIWVNEVTLVVALELFAAHSLA